MRNMAIRKRVRVELILHIERSQPRWSGYLIRMFPVVLYMNFLEHVLLEGGDGAN